MNQINKADSCCNISLFSQFLYLLNTTAMIILIENGKNVVHRCWNSKYLNSLILRSIWGFEYPNSILVQSSFSQPLPSIQRFSVFNIDVKGFFFVSLFTRFLVSGNSTKILTDIWHQFWHKNDVKSGAIEIIFKSHGSFQKY